jgi:molybdate transport system permease protein
MDQDLISLWITLKLATITTLVLLVIGTPLAWWLSQGKGWLRNLVEPVVALPIVLPPTVVGFYLLIAFSPESLPGELWQSVTGTTLAFSFSGLVIGSAIYSLPFFVQPLQVAFSGLRPELVEAAETLGAGPMDRFFNLIVPLCRRGFVIALCLSFAHTVGEFGIVLMIGGNLPDETRVLSIALFDHVEALNYERAHQLALGLMSFAFLILFALYSMDRRWRTRELDS